MAGKKRSGLANDRRAYGCGKNYRPGCPSITIADIASFNEDIGIFVLNNNTTILECQTLTIDLGYILGVPPGITLINNGTIVNNYVFGAIYGGAITNNGTIISNYNTNLINTSNLFINNGIINILDGCFFINARDYSLLDDVILTNNGNINIALGGTLRNILVLINNYSGGNINNRGTLRNEEANINNAGGTITNYSGGTIINDNSSTIYNNTGGTINNNSGATFTNNGTISNADGSSTCGIGIINGTISGTIDAQCPPP